MRGVKESNLDGLRKRISTLFLQYIKTPTFNPEAAKLLKVCISNICMKQMPSWWPPLHRCSSQSNKVCHLKIANDSYSTMPVNIAVQELTYNLPNYFQNFGKVFSFTVHDIYFDIGILT